MLLTGMRRPLTIPYLSRCRPSNYLLKMAPLSMFSDLIGTLPLTPSARLFMAIHFVWLLRPRLGPDPPRSIQADRYGADDTFCACDRSFYSAPILGAGSTLQRGTSLTYPRLPNPSAARHLSTPAHRPPGSCPRRSLRCTTLEYAALTGRFLLNADQPIRLLPSEFGRWIPLSFMFSARDSRRQPPHHFIVPPNPAANLTSAIPTPWSRLHPWRVGDSFRMTTTRRSSPLG